MVFYEATWNAILLLTLSLQANSACTRPALQKASDDFFTSAIAKSASTLSLAPSVRITQNNEFYPSLDKTLWSNLTSFRKPFRISALDTKTCQISTFTIPYTGSGSSSTSSLTSVRFKIQESGGAIEEIEIVNVGLSLPSLLPDTAPPKFTIPESTTRTELLRVIETYPTGIQAGSNIGTLTSPNCTRAENGFPMPIACNGLFQIFGFPVTSRRYVVDEEIGVVQAAFYFNQRKKGGSGMFSLWMHEYFKVEKGLITQIYAVMEPLWYDNFTDVWEAKTLARKGVAFLG
jgi:hypothetical protein